MSVPFEVVTVFRSGMEVRQSAASKGEADRLVMSSRETQGADSVTLWRGPGPLEKWSRHSGEWAQIFPRRR